MITEIEDYFSKGCGRCARFATPECSARRWSAGLHALRRICLAAGLEEAVKWGHPCYAHAGRNIAIIGAFRGDFRLSFFHSALLTDPERVLERQGPNTRHADMIRFVDDAAVGRMAGIVGRYLNEAMGYAAAGVRAPKEPGGVAMPEELSVALQADPDLSEAFARLTPGRQKSCLLAIGAAKTAATRVARVARFRGNILSGKGATER